MVPDANRDSGVIVTVASIIADLPGGDGAVTQILSLLFLQPQDS